MSCNGASSRDGACGAAIALSVLRMVSKPNVLNATTPTANNFFMSPPGSSRLRFEHENCGFLFVMSGCGDVVAVQFRGPERGTGTRFRGDFPNGFVMIGIFLLV